MYVEFKFSIQSNLKDELFEALAPCCHTISWIELNEHSWQIEGICEKNKQEEVSTKYDILNLIYDLNDSPIQFNELEEKDWVKENEQSFPSLQVASFYIYGSHLKEKKPEGKIDILMDAEAAFGSGRHESTQGCLTAIEKLSQQYVFKKPLDLGCGSGILAIALAKKFKTTIYASDIDPDSVRITKENAMKNHVDNIYPFLSDGLNNDDLTIHAPFDIIVANILALPLCKLAHSIARNTTGNAKIILSGLLNEQTETVLKAYIDQGFHLIDTIIIGQWSTLLLNKN
jgi:ribosomal protein L11 methyltransferase